MSKVTVETLISQMNLKLIAGEDGLQNEIEGGYVGDLLSFVMAHAKEKNIWITIQGHINSIAVASLLELSAIILSEDVTPDEEMIQKANEEGIPVLCTTHNSFDVICEFVSVNKEQEN